MQLYYDLHLHSCLSPCGSEDMTPANLAAMCALAGLEVVALTDHNTTGNCRAFCRAARTWGLLPLAGMELCTQEEIHLVCLFPDPDQAEAFEAAIAPTLPPFPNDAEIFGRQILMNEADEVLGEDTRFLAGSTGITLEQAPILAGQYGGVVFPAHIDRPSFSLLGVLGLWAPELGFSAAELSHNCPPEFTRRPDLTGVRFLSNSDAHYLDQVWTAEHTLQLNGRTAQDVLDCLRG